ncbi:hypothetical protein NE235_30910 [Actinoallomurus spadix]|uniref:hypothetical protein n=1 Tax=Actinoallomurus spadix TaxID=79912 RepID=UPI00209399D2|nr:hypothetical protein [Actinoallomurus spadix]MCO5990528.1 hypothetical protein [Actinoallomurus spadix]
MFMWPWVQLLLLQGMLLRLQRLTGGVSAGDRRPRSRAGATPAIRPLARER